MFDLQTQPEIKALHQEIGDNDGQSRISSVHFVNKDPFGVGVGSQGRQEKEIADTLPVIFITMYLHHNVVS